MTDVKLMALINEGAVTADVVVFPDGLSVLHWRTSPAATEIYTSEEELRAVREASGRSKLEAVGD